MPAPLSDTQRQRLADFIAPFRVDPGRRVHLPRDFDPAYKAGLRKKKEGVALLDEGVQLLAHYQARLAAQSNWGVLVILQALDTAGKDGTIRHVMSGINPQGVSVHGFKVPSTEELGHDFLWRYVQRLPARGQIGIFNRSHYEEVLVVRVHPESLDRQGLPPEVERGDIWQRRYREINDWERYLSDNGLRIVKLFLNISKEEQRRRLLRRIDLPSHRWKFSQADVVERARFEDYQDAISQALSHTSTEWAPWWVIPADRKWFARVAASSVIVNALIDIDPHFPDVGGDQLKVLQIAKRRLETEAPDGMPSDPVETKRAQET